MSITGTVSAQQSAAPPTKILGISDVDGQAPSKDNPLLIGLGQRLKVTVDGTANLDPADYVLYLDGRPINGLDDTVFVNTNGEHALVFRLLRTDANKSVWKGLLGSPSQWSVPVTVALGTTSAQTLAGDGKTNILNLALASGGRLFFSATAIVLVILLVWAGMKQTTLLKDNWLPQIAPAQQTYSLGRCQMAFWFTLVFAAFVALFALLWDFHGIVSTQALWLMGISGVTGVGAVAIDIVKDTPADMANRALRALGLNDYADVERVRLEIAERQSQLRANPAPAPAVIAKLSLEIRDRELLLKSYENTIRPFLSGGWFSDITTDQNGTSLPRLQTFCWTCALGAVFLIGVYTNLAMPELDTSLLLLMGISGAGYLGFKYPEPQQ
jgi:hypothetical protein